jgi:asparagine synthase (glutamine-hydrolysing)
LAEFLYEGNPESCKAVSSWLLGADCDFVIVFLRKEINEIIILNDALGRLPVYLFRGSHFCVISREIRFIVNYLGHVGYDMMGIAEFLLFGYTLGRRTLFENVERLQPATLLRFNGTSLHYSIERLHIFNFDSKQNSTRTVDENAAELVALFRESCRRRADKKGRNFVSLSGGLDSRVVAAGFHEESIPFTNTGSRTSNGEPKRGAYPSGVNADAGAEFWAFYYLVTSRRPRISKTRQRLPNCSTYRQNTF